MTAACGKEENSTAAEPEETKAAVMPEMTDLVLWEKALDSKADVPAASISHNYTAPAGLGGDIHSNTCELDGKVYSFPTPMEELAADGWYIVCVFTDDEEAIAPGEVAEAALEKDGRMIAFDVCLSNPYDETISLEQGLITHMRFDSERSRVELNLP